MIGRIALVAGGAIGAAGAALLAKKAQRQKTPPEEDRWLTVTIAAGREEIAPNGAAPHPLAELGDAVEFRLEAAPGSWGFELSARPSGLNTERLRSRARGGDPREAVRIALRESKQLLEVGEILRIDPRPSGQRKHTPAGTALDALTRKSIGEGVL
jgi:hypothetical protein